jgi:cyclophilin family peptidyl-prolyl cis-trans isomerase
MSVRTLVCLVTVCLAFTLFGRDAAAQSSDNPVVAIETSLGTITAELDRANAPISVGNFLQYIESDHYSGTIFHRVIKGFMIQGGGFTPDMTQKPVRPPIKNEARNGLSNVRGTLAMARTNIVDSATSQFFINTVDNNPLDNSGVTPDAYGYAVFGRVTAGLDVLDSIEGVATGTRGPYQNVPDTAVEILSVTVQ